MKRSRLLLPGLLALVLLAAAACSPPPELRDQNLLNDRSLVTGEPCAAPCWRGIIPGETTWSDALTILEDDSSLEDPTVQTAEDSAAVAASFKEPGGADASGQVFSEDGRTVSLVFLRVAPDMTLDEVLAVHGAPAYVIGTDFSDDPPQAIVNLVYPDIPMIVYAFVAGKDGALDGSNEIVGVLYMRPEDMTTLIESSNLHVWEGMADFSTYGPDAPFEITPIPVAEETTEPTTAP